VFEPAHVLEFFATTDGQAVLANVSDAKIGSKGRLLPGSARVELGAFDPYDDLILEDEQGFVRKADTNEVGVMLAHPRGPVDPTASVRRGVFTAADTWVATDYLFRRDEDGDYWLVDNRNSVIRTARGPIFASPINDAVCAITSVDMAVTYGVQVGDTQVAVTALTLAPGGSVSAGDVTEALSNLPVGDPPDYVHVVPDMALGSFYRPLLTPLRDAGVPTASGQAWSYNPDTDEFKQLIASAEAAETGDRRSFDA
jgi:putative long chain acyl-CoA synthase